MLRGARPRSTSCRSVRHMPGRLRRRCAVATTALLLAASVAACSDGSSEDAAEDSAQSTPSASTSDVTPSGSPSPTSSPTPVEPRKPKAPPAKDTVAGRQAFAEFVIETWSYSLATNDETALTDLSPKSGPCQGCAEFSTELHVRNKQGWYVDFPGVRIVKLPPPVSLSSEPGVYVATATMNVARSTSYFDDGSVRNENDGRRGATFEVRMRLDGKRYSLLAFRVS